MATVLYSVQLCCSECHGLRRKSRSDGLGSVLIIITIIIISSLQRSCFVLLGRIDAEQSSTFDTPSAHFRLRYILLTTRLARLTTSGSAHKSVALIVRTQRILFSIRHRSFIRILDHSFSSRHTGGISHSVEIGSASAAFPLLAWYYRWVLRGVYTLLLHRRCLTKSGCLGGNMG